jgi:hypothetical protein
MKILSFLIVIFSLVVSGCSGISPRPAEDQSYVSPLASSDKSPVTKPAVKQTAKPHKKGQLTLTWDAVAGASWYNLYYGTKPGVTRYSKKKITKIDATSHTVTGLSPGTVYYFVVTAANARTESDESCEVSGKAKN